MFKTILIALFSFVEVRNRFFQRKEIGLIGVKLNKPAKKEKGRFLLLSCI